MLWKWAKRRAKLCGIPFSIKLDDIRIPLICPLLGIKLAKASVTTSTSPSLDRIVPSSGYVPGNILVISHRANTLKNSASFEEMEMIVENWRALRAK